MLKVWRRQRYDGAKIFFLLENECTNVMDSMAMDFEVKLDWWLVWGCLGWHELLEEMESSLCSATAIIAYIPTLRAAGKPAKIIKNRTKAF